MEESRRDFLRKFPLRAGAILYGASQAPSATNAVVNFVTELGTRAVAEQTKETEFSNRQLVDFFNATFQGTLKIDLDNSHYKNDDLYSKPFPAEKIDNRCIALVWALSTAIKERTGALQRISQDGPTTLYFSDELYTNLGERLGGACDCYGIDKTMSDTITLGLFPYALNQDQFFAHELTHATDAEYMPRDSDHYPWQGWHTKGPDALLIPLQINHTYDPEMMPQQRKPAFTSDSIRQFHELYLVNSDEYSQEGNHAAGGVVKGDMSYSQMKFSEPEFATVSLTYAGTNRNELVAVLAGEVVPYQGKEGVKRNFGPGIENALRELLPLAREQNTLYPSDSTGFDYTSEFVSSFDPAIFAIRQKMKEGIDDETLIEQMVEESCEQICQIACVEVWNMSPEQLAAAEKQDYAFLQDYYITGYRSQRSFSDDEWDQRIKRRFPQYQRLSRSHDILTSAVRTMKEAIKGSMAAITS